MKNSSRRKFLQTGLALGALPLMAKTKEPSMQTQQNLKFIHITDSHMDLQDSDSVEALQLAVEFINKKYSDIHFVLFGGDNFNNNVPGYADAKKFKEIIEKLHCPSYLVRGNKESSPKPQGDPLNLRDFQKMFWSGQKKLYREGKNWLLDTHGYIVLGLDSNIENQNNGLYTQETIAFAKKILDSGRPTVILNHHPYLNYWKGEDPKDIHKYVLNNADKVIEELFVYDNLLLTLSGHKHIDNVSTIKNTTAITTRGFIRPLDLDQYPMRYVELNGKNITHKLVYTA